MFKIEKYQIGNEKVMLKTLEEGSFFIPTSPELDLKVFELKSRPKVSTKYLVHSVTTFKYDYLLGEELVVKLTPRKNTSSVSVEDCICEGFADKWGHSKRTSEHRYLSPLEIVYSDGNQPSFEEFNESFLEENPETTLTGEDIHVEYLDTLPNWKGDLSDVVSFFMSNGIIDDFTDNEKGGFVWTEGCEKMFWSPAADVWRETEKGRGMMTFQQFFEDFMTNEDWEIFVRCHVIENA